MQLPMAQVDESADEAAAAPAAPAPNPYDAARYKRKSNEVAGFEYSYIKTIFVSIGSALMFVLLMPFLPIITSIQTGNWRFTRRYFHTAWFYIKLLPGYIIYGTLLRTIRYNFFMTPSQQAERIKLRRGACTRCGKCCNQLGCIFLDKDEQDNMICSVYGTTFWYYGTCGRYPLSQKDVDDHACPGFTFYDEEGKLVYEV